MIKILTSSLAALALLASAACTSTETVGGEPTDTTAATVLTDSTVVDAQPVAAVEPPRVTDDEPGVEPFIVFDQPDLTADEQTTLDAAEAAADDAEASLGDATEEAVAEARQAAAVGVAQSAGLEVTAPSSPAGVGIYGGSGENVCDVEGIIAFLTQNPDQAAAWAGVQSIAVDEIESFVRALTPGRLVADTEVLNHGFKDGVARANPSVLAAGTAVLVDEAGIPRVRCKCGNPLLSSGAIQPQQWADEIVDASISPDTAGGRENPQNLLGPIDWESSGEDVRTYVALGNSSTDCEFFVTVEFTDNRLIDGPGDDLRIFEIGTSYGSGGGPEAMDVYAEIDGDFVLIEAEPGEEQAIDLAGQFGDTEIAVIRICDSTSNNSPSPAPGADIDAVATLNWVAGT